MAITINSKLCPQNHHCPLIGICPVEAISQQGFALPKIDSSRCIECGACIDKCGKGAVETER